MGTGAQHYGKPCRTPHVDLSLNPHSLPGGGNSQPRGPRGRGSPNAPPVMQLRQRGAGGGGRAHPGHASPWLWGASEIPRAHSLHPAGFRSAERPRSLPRDGRACLGCLTPLARAVPAGCRCAGRALTGTHVPRGPHGGAALVPDGAQVRMLPLSIPSRVTWGKTLQVSVPRFPHV